MSKLRRTVGSAGLIVGPILFVFGLPGHIDDAMWWHTWITSLNLSQTLGIVALVVSLMYVSYTWWASLYVRFVRKDDGEGEQKHSDTSVVVTHVSSDLEPSPAVEAFGEYAILDRIYTRTAPEQMQEEYRGKMTIQAEQAVKPYIGKWLFIDSRIDNMTIMDDGRISMRLPGDPATVFLSFDTRWRRTLEVLERDTRIVAAGRIDDVNSLWVNVGSCELYHYQ